MVRLRILLKRTIRTDTQMGVDGSITSRARQVLVFTVWDMEMGLWVAVLFGETKVNDIDLVATFANAHQKVVRLDVTVDKGLCVNVFDARDELVGEQEDRLEGEFAVAKVEEIFQAGSEEVKNHGIVVALGAEPTDKWNANSSGEGLVHAGFIFQLRVFGLYAFELDGNLFPRDNVGT
jgi:hypothetical protein